MRIKFRLISFSEAQKWLNKNWFWAATILILILAAVFRFYNFPSRFAFGEDQARDVLVVQEIISTKNIPLIGPPSSAGPFSYGPWYYWILSLVSLIFPFFASPWVLVTLISILSVFVLIFTGRVLGGDAVGIIAGFLAVVSTAELRVSAHLADVSFVGIFAALSVFGFVSYIKTGKSIFAFLIGLAIAFAANMHFSAVALLLLIPSMLIFKIPKVKSFLALLTGLLIPFVPLIFFNATHNWIIVRNLFNFFLFGQQKFWVSIRWLTYLKDFWPEVWAGIIGGSSLLSYLIIFLLLLFLIKDFLKRNIDRSLIALLFTFVLQVILLRYWRGEKQVVYFLYFDPLILVFTTWCVWKVFNISKFIGVILIVVLMVGSFIADLEHLNYKNQFPTIDALKKELISKYPNSHFSIYNCGHSYARSGSLPLSLLLNNEHRISDGGKLVGVYLPELSEKQTLASIQPKIIAQKGAYTIVEMKSGDIPLQCASVAISKVYKDTVLLY